MILRKIDIVSCGKLLGAMYACLGILVGLLFVPIAVIGANANPRGNENELVAVVAGGLCMAVAAPIFYGVIGFVLGIVGAAIYNWVASMVGGIRVELVADTEDRGDPYSNPYGPPRD